MSSRNYKDPQCNICGKHHRKQSQIDLCQKRSKYQKKTGSVNYPITALLEHDKNINGLEALKNKIINGDDVNAISILANSYTDEEGNYPNFKGWEVIRDSEISMDYSWYATRTLSNGKSFITITDSGDDYETPFENKKYDDVSKWSYSQELPELDPEERIIRDNTDKLSKLEINNILSTINNQEYNSSLTKQEVRISPDDLIKIKELQQKYPENTNNIQEFLDTGRKDSLIIHSKIYSRKALEKLLKNNMQN